MKIITSKQLIDRIADYEFGKFGLNNVNNSSVKINNPKFNIGNKQVVGDLVIESDGKKQVFKDEVWEIGTIFLSNNETLKIVNDCTDKELDKEDYLIIWDTLLRYKRKALNEYPELGLESHKTMERIKDIMFKINEHYL